FFKDELQIADIIQQETDTELKSKWLSQNAERLHTVYNWDKIIHTYYELFRQIKPRDFTRN
ncbi:MAG: hypothetical protein ACOYOV_16015, partial [Bacteroidales bacterium]